MSNKKSNTGQKILVLTGVAVQMGGTIFLGAFAGKKLDLYFQNEKKWYTIGLTLLAVAIALYYVVKQTNKLNSKEDSQ